MQVEPRARPRGWSGLVFYVVSMLYECLGCMMMTFRFLWHISQYSYSCVVVIVVVMMLT